MLVINILSGPQAGQSIELKQGRTTIGRGPSADVQIASSNISKEHAAIELFSDKIIISDLNSTNGTFVNGVKIHSQRLKAGDKILLYKVLIEVTEVPDIQPQTGTNHSYTGNHMGHQPMYTGNTAMNQQPQYGTQALYQQQGHQAQHNHQQQQAHHQQQQQPQSQQVTGLPGLLERMRTYIDEVMMPGVYKLPELMEFRWVLTLFMVMFVVITTSLSTIPLVRILKESIESESQQRALTIARALARANRSAIMNNQESIVSVEVAEKETGVEQAMVIKASNGSVIAPPRLMGQFPDVAFIHMGRKLGKEGVSQIDDDTIGAMAPIAFYNPNTGNQSVQAYAVVVYEMGALAVNDSRTLSLFIQTFFIALVVGGILFFFIFKLVEHPILSLNGQLDTALKDGRDTIETPYDFPALKKLTTNINSALTKILTGADSHSDGPMDYDRNIEMQNLAQLIGFGSIAISAVDLTIVFVNDAFAEKTHISAHEVCGTPLVNLTDQALKLNLEDLVTRSIETPDQLVTNELEIGGVNHELAAQAVYGLNAVSYVLIALMPLGEEDY